MAVAAARVSLCATFLVVAGWALGPLGGVSWSPERDPATGSVTSTSKLFNWHPILMAFAFLVCSGEAMLAYRSSTPLLVPAPATRNARKSAHAAMHASALVIAILGSTAAFRSHNLADPPIPNLYSPHSWVGATAMTLFLAQAALGTAVFLFPGLQPPERRASFSPWHRLLGSCAFFAALVAIATGLQEKATFAQAYGKEDVRGPVVRTAALAELGVLASAFCVGAALFFSAPAIAGPGAGGGYGGLSGREEEGLLPSRGGD